MSSTEGIRGGAAALHYWELRQEVAAHNLSNASSPGFKAERVFSRLLDGRTQLASAALDLTPGTLTNTERPLDVAIDGGGYFVVRTAAGERLSRGGSWSIDAERHLVEADGAPVLFENGTPTLPEGELRITQDGDVQVNGQRIGRLRLEQPAAGAMLFHEAGARLRSDRGTTALAERERVVKQGQLEESNVNVLESMVEMVEIQRAYASVQRSISVLDGTMDTAVNRLGRL